MAELILGFVVTSHAKSAMKRRDISEKTVREVLSAPEQRLPVRPGREVLQSKIERGGKRYLVRAFVDVGRHPPELVTVYRTSKIGKYWSGTS